MLSLSSTGTPCSGPRAPFCRRSRSSVAAISSASRLSSITERIADPRWSSARILRRYAAVSAADVSRPAAIAAPRSSIVLSRWRKRAPGVRTGGRSPFTGPLYDRGRSHARRTRGSRTSVLFPGLPWRPPFDLPSGWEGSETIVMLTSTPRHLCRRFAASALAGVVSLALGAATAQASVTIPAVEMSNSRTRSDRPSPRDTSP